MLKRKKMLVYPLFFLVFLGAMWLIFAPSDSDEPLREGFNVDVPMPEDKGLLSDKKTAYEQSAFEKKQKEKMNTLQNLAVSLEQEEPAADEVFLTEEDTDNGSPSIRSSANAYQDINRQLGSFYETRLRRRSENTGTGMAHSGAGASGGGRAQGQRKQRGATAADGEVLRDGGKVHAGRR